MSAARDLADMDTELTVSLSGVKGQLAIKEVKGGYRSIFYRTTDDEIYISGHYAGSNVPTNEVDVDLFGFFNVPLDNSSGIKSWYVLAYGALVLMNDGTLWGWGEGDSYKMGTGSTDDVAVPTILATDVDELKVATHRTYNHNYSACFYKKDGIWYAWGVNTYGRLGLGHSDTVTEPEQLMDLPDGGDIEELWPLGASCGCLFARSSLGTLYAVGWNTYGSLGIGTTTDMVDWTEVLNIDGSLVKDIKGGYGYYASDSQTQSSTFFLLTDGTVWAAGDDDWGQLGQGTQYSDVTSPVDVGLTNITEIYCVGGGPVTVYAVKGDLEETTTIYAWGYNTYGQCGTTTSPCKTPNEITLPVPLKQLAACEEYQGHNYSYTVHIVFLLTDGTLYGLGNNAYGQLSPVGGSTDDCSDLTQLAFYDTDIESVCITHSGTSEAGQTFIVMNDGRCYGCGYAGYAVLWSIFSGNTDWSSMRVPRRLV